MGKFILSTPMQGGAICDICHIGPLQPHVFEQRRGFDRTEGEVKTSALFKTIRSQRTDMTETSRDHLKFPLNGSDAKGRIHLMETLDGRVMFQVRPTKRQLR